MSHVIKIPKLLPIYLDKKPKPKKRNTRHHASKNFKPASKTKIKDRIINTENPTKEDMIVVEELCKLWWNSRDSSSYIKKLLDRLEPVKDKYEKEEVLKPIYWHVCSNSPEFKKEITRALFTYNFILGVPFFKKWLKIEEMSKKSVIRGDLQYQILDILYNCKTIKIESIFKHFEMTHFEAEIKGILTRMTSKKYIECINFSDRLFYKINSRIEFYNEKWYI